MAKVTRQLPVQSRRGRRGGLLARQRARYSQLRGWLRRRLEETKSMTPAERAKADAEWDALSRSVNAERARAGARLLYPNA